VERLATILVGTTIVTAFAAAALAVWQFGGPIAGLSLFVGLQWGLHRLLSHPRRSRRPF